MKVAGRDPAVARQTWYVFEVQPDEEGIATMKTIRAFIWGSAIGAAVGLLFAPDRGEVTRAQLQERLNQWQGMTQSQLGNLRGTASNAIESGRQAVNSTLGQAQNATNKTADKAQQQVGSTNI